MRLVKQAFDFFFSTVGWMMNVSKWILGVSKSIHHRTKVCIKTLPDVYYKQTYCSLEVVWNIGFNHKLIKN